jgi:hypothetical protein
MVRSSRTARLVTLFGLCLVVAAPSAGLAAGRSRPAKGGERSSARAGAKVALFPLKYDDDRTLTVQIERILRNKGMEVVTGVRPVDTAEQYREVATAMGLAAFVGGDYIEKNDKATVTVQVRSGYTGKKLTAPTFKETPLHMHNEIETKLWAKIGPTVSRACVEANRPRKKGRNPLMIDAGSPLEAALPPPPKARPAAPPPPPLAARQPRQARTTTASTEPEF